jgi:GNAT superfamily N-acetyltransferase
MSILIQRCDPESADALVLVAELSGALAAITGDSGASSFAVADARVPRSLFVLARDAQGQLLGCGALRPMEGVVGAVGAVGELKRMYARPGTSGVGSALLNHLEQAAREFAYAELWLETRRVNTRAVHFYLKHGYAQIDNYGKYVGRPEAICLAKSVAAASSQAASAACDFP